MHELSIAANIIEIAEEFAAGHKGAQIRKVELVVGKLSGIVRDSLDFAMEIAVKNTILENAEILIEEVDGKSVCNKCHTEYINNDWYTPCPSCGALDFEITAGKELRVKSIFFD
jgi:hydrogenase nickel incorporation protein HypA/HybF